MLLQIGLFFGNACIVWWKVQTLRGKGSGCETTPWWPLLTIRRVPLKA
jgi:hypothetical protein